MKTRYVECRKVTDDDCACDRGGCQTQMPPSCYFMTLLMENGGGDFFNPTFVSTLSFNDGFFFLQHFLQSLHLYLQQNCTMAMVKRMARIPKPTAIPTAVGFTVLPLFPIADEPDVIACLSSPLLPVR